MSTAPSHPCPTPHCGTLVKGPGLCARCRSKRDRLRGTPRERGYDSWWAAYSKAWLARYPWCGQRYGGAFSAEQSRCVQRGVRQPAQVTDHIVAIRAGGARMDPRNHQSLCMSCNTRKSVTRTR